MRRRWLGVLLTAGVVGALIALEVTTSGVSNDPEARRPAPELPRAVVVPPAVTLKDLRGRPVVVNFWASWCDPCRREASELRVLAERVRGRVAVVGVSWTDDLAGARRFVRRYGWKFPNLSDPDGQVGNRYRLAGIPTTFVLDRQGRIAARLQGPQTASSVERAINKAER